MRRLIYTIQDVDRCWGNLPHQKSLAIEEYLSTDKKGSLGACDYSPALSNFYSTISPVLQRVFICTARETGFKKDLEALQMINTQSMQDHAQKYSIEAARQHLLEILGDAEEKVKVSTAYDDPVGVVGNAMDAFFKAEANSTSFDKSQIKHKDKCSQYQMIFREILKDLRDTNDSDACAEVVMFDDAEHNHEAFEQAIQSLSPAYCTKITARSVQYVFNSLDGPDGFIPKYNHRLFSLGGFPELAEDLKQKADQASTAASASTVVLASAVPVSTLPVVALASTVADQQETNVHIQKKYWAIFKHKMQVLVLAGSTVSVLGVGAALTAVHNGSTMNIIALGMCHVSIGVLNFCIGVLNAAGISISTLGTVSTVSTALPFGIAAAVLIIGLPVIFAGLATAFNALSKPPRDVRPLDDQTSKRQSAAQLKGAAAMPADGSGYIGRSAQRVDKAVHTLGS